MRFPLPRRLSWGPVQILSALCPFFLFSPTLPSPNLLSEQKAVGAFISCQCALVTFNSEESVFLASLIGPEGSHQLIISTSPPCLR